MVYDTTTAIPCRDCGIVIPCVFDDEVEVEVANIAETNATPGQTVGTSEEPGRTVLIYLTCPNFHGPYPYKIKVKEIIHGQHKG